MYINKQINKQKSTSKKTITCNRPIHIYSHSHLLYNSAENEWIWMNSGALWVHCWGLTLADFGFDPRSSDSLRGSQNFVLLFCPPISCRTNFYDIWTQQRRSASPYKRSEHNFGNFTIRGRFFQKKTQNKKCSQNFQVFRLQAPQLRNDYKSPETRYQDSPLQDVEFPFLLLTAIQNHSPGLYAAYKERTSHIFRPMSDIG